MCRYLTPQEFDSTGGCADRLHCFKLDHSRPQDLCSTEKTDLSRIELEDASSDESQGEHTAPHRPPPASMQETREPRTEVRSSREGNCPSIRAAVPSRPAGLPFTDGLRDTIVLHMHMGAAI